MDIFDMEGKKPPAEGEAAPQGETPTEAPARGEYVIQAVVPMPAGWMACYDDQDQKGQVIMFPIAALAVIALKHPSGEVEQVLRHMVSTPMGQIDDIAEIPGFICVTAPGQDPDQIVPAIQTLRARLAGVQ